MHPPPPEAPRSAFLSFVAVAFIVLAGFSTLVALLQVVVLNLFVPADVFAEFGGASAGGAEAPALVRFAVQNVRTIAFLGFAASALLLVSAIGLLRRRDWARRVFMALVSLGALFEAATAAVLGYLAFLPEPPAWLVPPGAAAKAGRSVTVTAMDSDAGLGELALSGLVIAALLAWLVSWLHSKAVRAEFGAD